MIKNGDIIQVLFDPVHEIKWQDVTTPSAMILLFLGLAMSLLCGCLLLVFSSFFFIFSSFFLNFF